VPFETAEQFERDLETRTRKYLDTVTMQLMLGDLAKTSFLNIETKIGGSIK